MSLSVGMNRSNVRRMLGNAIPTVCSAIALLSAVLGLLLVLFGVVGGVELADGYRLLGLVHTGTQIAIYLACIGAGCGLFALAWAIDCARGTFESTDPLELDRGMRDFVGVQ